MTGPSEADRRFMREALRLAERGRGKTRPNPVVGAMVVKDGKVLARGYHHGAGLPHAEIDALSKLGMRAPGATLYVTLEPCCHVGRTPPCTDSILASGVRRVVVGCLDDNPIVSSRGIKTLRKAGLHVDVGCLADECRQRNRAFFTWIRHHRPHVTLKVASTFDGLIGNRREREREGEARFITGPKAREMAHLLRAEHDAVLVGVGTILCDDARLTVRLPRGAQGRTSTSHPRRIVLDSQLRTKPTASLLCERQGGPPLLIALRPAADDAGFARRRRRLEAAGADIVIAPGRNGRVALAPLLRLLADQQIQSLLVEGGSHVHSSFISAGLVDSVALFLAPRLVGSGVPVVEGTGLDWKAPAKLGPVSVRALGEDILLAADVIDRGQRSHRSRK